MAPSVSRSTQVGFKFQSHLCSSVKPIQLGICMGGCSILEPHCEFYSIADQLESVFVTEKHAVDGKTNICQPLSLEMDKSSKSTERLMVVK